MKDIKKEILKNKVSAEITKSIYSIADIDIDICEIITDALMNNKIPHVTINF